MFNLKTEIFPLVWVLVKNLTTQNQMCTCLRQTPNFFDNKTGNTTVKVMSNRMTTVIFLQTEEY